MCGFVGYLLPNATAAPDIYRWGELIHHRGPDQAGIVSDGPFGIATRRLAILDLSMAGNQPMWSDRYILGFNGEIYNHQQIRTELEAERSTNWNGHSDTETVLRAIEHWGLTATLERLNGMYALALFDRRDRSLTLARDPLGIKPLLYLPQAGGLLFASELKALLPYSTQQLSADGVALYLLLGFTPAPYSLIAGIHKLTPGEVYQIGPTGETRHWIVPRVWQEAPLPATQRHERVGQLREIVVAAVQCQLLSDVPLGCFLSGGIDSTVVAGIAARSTKSLSSFSICPEDVSADPGVQADSQVAARIARQYGFHHYELKLQPAELTTQLDSLITLLDEPTAELYATAEILLSRAARAAGVPVVLTGHGADEVFLGYPSYTAQIKGERYDSIPWFGPALRLLAILPTTSRDTRENLQGAADTWRQPFLERYTRFAATHFHFDESAKLAGITPVRLRILLDTILSHVHAAVARLSGDQVPGVVERFARMDLFLKVAEHYNMRVDRASMSASVEARVPLQDLALVGFVARLSAADLLQGGFKGMFRQACADLIPPEVAKRTKQNFQAPMRSWIGGALQPWIQAQLAQLPRHYHTQLTADDYQGVTTRHAYRAWSLALLEAWRNTCQLSYER